MNILILDIGTTSMRGILFDHAGNRLAIARRENHLVHMGEVMIEEDPDEFIHHTVGICREITSGFTVDAVAITAQRSSVIPVDSDGEPLLAAIMWQDTRNKDIIAEMARYNDRLLQITGAQASTVFSAGKMTWIRRYQPNIYARTARFLNIPEFVVRKMTGCFVSDDTYASRTGLLNLRTLDWEKELLELYEIDENRLCRRIRPGQVAGYVTNAFAKLSGLTTGIPVIHSGGDQQCAAIGHGVLREGDLSITIGTGGFLCGACETLPEVLPEGMIHNCASIAGTYVREANVLSCGAAYDWCARSLYGMETIDHDLLEAELNHENFVSSCLVVPYFAGKGAPDWDPGARAMFANVNTATRRSELFKGVMEGVFMEIGTAVRRFGGTGNIHTGGGLTLSRALDQLQADVYGRRVYVVKDSEATARGALSVALCGLGLFASVAQAAETIGCQEMEVFEPDAARHAAYVVKQQEMKALYERTRS